MKVDTTHSASVERDGIANDGAFSIQFNAKMAKILSDGLYSDKIQSIVREIACNAVDSHVEAGYADRPIEVHLPTTWEPWFHVRDFGVGLDHNQVIGIYTVYGASTKTNSNEFIGQLGLGSKSPFSYVDAFDVTARKDGVERQYSMYKNEEGMPSVAMLGEFATTEPNGVTVKMPVKQEDIRRFAEKAALVFSWFDTKPTITGVSSLQIFEHNIAYEGIGWKLRKRNNNAYSNDPVNRAVALMGRVAYPLDSNSINDLTVAQKTLLEMPIVLAFDIGELEVAASREGLGYDKRTQTNVRNKLDAMLVDMAVEFEKKIAAATTEWEARRLFGEIFGMDSGFRYEFEKIFGNHGLMWQGWLIKHATVTLKTSDLWDQKQIHSPRIWRTVSHFKTARQMSYFDPLTLRCSNDVIVVFDDLERGTLSRVNYLHQQNFMQKEVVVIGPSSLKTVAEIVALMGNPDYIMASDLPKRPSAGRGQRVTMLEYNEHIYNAGAKVWSSATVDLDDGGLYVVMDRYTVMNGESICYNLSAIRAKAIEIGIITNKTPIFSPRAEMRKKVAEHSNWVNFFDFVRSEIANRLNPAVLQEVADINEWHTVTRNACDTSMWQCKLPILHKQGIFGQFVDAMQLLEKKYNKGGAYSSLISLALDFGQEITLPNPSVDAQGLYKMVLASYPMLILSFDRYNNKNIISSNARQYSDYINMCDEYSKMVMENAVDSLIAA